MKKLLLVASCLLSACSSIPDNLKVADGTPLVAFADAHVQKTSAVGETARWGGIIAKVDNLPDQTRLEIVVFPLQSSAKPKQSDESLGRFRAYAKGLLDPMIYKVGKSVTVVGQIAPNEAGKIGEHEYSYPVLAASAVHLWKNKERFNMRVEPDPFWGTPGLWYPYASPFLGNSVVITKQNANQSQPPARVPANKSDRR